MLAVRDLEPPDVMIDTETMGTRPGAVIIGIGILMFRPRLWREDDDRDWRRTLVHRKLHVSIDSCLRRGLVVEGSAIRFWMRQPDAARADAFPDESLEISIEDACMEVRNFLVMEGPSENGRFLGRVWCHGAGFDVPIVGAAMRVCGVHEPWDFRKVRDTRTIFDAAGISHSGTAHEPISDCIEQAAKVSQALARIERTLGGVPTAGKIVEVDTTVAAA